MVEGTWDIYPEKDSDLYIDYVLSCEKWNSFDCLVPKIVVVLNLFWLMDSLRIWKIRLLSLNKYSHAVAFNFKGFKDACEAHSCSPDWELTAQWGWMGKTRSMLT